jgi:Eukaryotic cytochrome b561
MPLSIDKLLDWWLSPLSGAATHTLQVWVIWHARLMVLAWAVLLPAGALVARYFKVMPSQDWPREVDNRGWWHMHQSLQYGGVAVMVLGLYLVWNNAAQSAVAAVWHGYLGWCVVALSAIQILGAWMRGSKGGPTEAQMRGDHYDMTTHRRWFEGIHKTCGWVAVLLAVATVVFGLWAADAPRWMVLVLAIWWICLLVFGIWLQRTGRCVDTYQAIWGPHPSHPGNRRHHVGWGARRANFDQEKI